MGGAGSWGKDFFRRITVTVTNIKEEVEDKAVMHIYVRTWYTFGSVCHTKTESLLAVSLTNRASCLFFNIWGYLHTIIRYILHTYQRQELAFYEYIRRCWEVILPCWSLVLGYDALHLLQPLKKFLQAIGSLAWKRRRTKI